MRVRFAKEKNRGMRQQTTNQTYIHVVGILCYVASYGRDCWSTVLFGSDLIIVSLIHKINCIIGYHLTYNIP